MNPKEQETKSKSVQGVALNKVKRVANVLAAYWPQPGQVFD